MSRYKLQFKPQGIIPQDVTIGVKMTPVVEPGQGGGPCISFFSGWSVTVDGIPQIGTGPFNVSDAAWVATITHQGALCPGECLVWTVVGFSTGAGGDLSDIAIAPNGCEASDVNAPYTTGNYLGCFANASATLNGQPFGAVVTFLVGCTPAYNFSGFEWEVDGVIGTTGSYPDTFGFSNTIQYGGPIGIAADYCERELVADCAIPDGSGNTQTFGTFGGFAANGALVIDSTGIFTSGSVAGTSFVVIISSTNPFTGLKEQFGPPITLTCSV